MDRGLRAPYGQVEQEGGRKSLQVLRGSCGEGQGSSGGMGRQEKSDMLDFGAAFWMEVLGLVGMYPGRFPGPFLNGGEQP